jgi:hypothetical protein
MDLWRTREAEKQVKKQEIKSKERAIKKLEHLEAILTQKLQERKKAKNEVMEFIDKKTKLPLNFSGSLPLLSDSDPKLKS